MQEWFYINNIDRIDSPALIMYPDRIQANIDLVIQMARGCDKLRPHVKTNKTPEVCRMMLDAGITKFKCATIAEAEMLGMVEAPDVLLAYQPTGPKVQRLLNLVKAYPKTTYSCLIDNERNADYIAGLCESNGVTLNVFVDLNIGMNRTGVRPETAPALIGKIIGHKSLRIVGLHGYDGHIHDCEIAKRQADSDIAFAAAEKVFNAVQPLFPYPLTLVMGGTPTFPMHARRRNCECSPGTFVFWDWGYKHMLEEMTFQYAALIVTRVISIIDGEHVCTDLGYKSVSSESPLPRIHFINAQGSTPVSQSEEHLVLKVVDSGDYKVGDVLYGIPVHICPTVALYEKAYVVKDNEFIAQWNVVARNRFINY